MSSQDAPWRLSSLVSTALGSALEAAWRSIDGPLAEIAGRVVGSGGRRLRPALTLAAADGSPRAIRAAAAIELLHTAALVHDDLIDGAATRRGEPTVAAAHGCATAVLVGDALVAAAHQRAARAHPDGPAVLADTLAALVRGEALQRARAFDTNVSARDVLQVAELKSGALMAAACELGGRCADLPEPTIAALSQFGCLFGVTLQVLDDLLDVYGEPHSAGKPVAQDFASGTVTMPAVFAMQHDARLRAYLRPGLDSGERAEVSRRLRGGAATDATLLVVHQLARRARRTLLAAQPTPALEALATWPERLVDEQLAALGLPTARPASSAASSA